MQRRNKKQSLLILTMALAGGFVANVGLASAEGQASKNASRSELIALQLTPQTGKSAAKKTASYLAKRLVVSADGVGEQSILVNSRASLDLSVLFAPQSEELTDKGRILLDDLASALDSKKLQNATYLLGGHTDTQGDDEANRALSERRARSAKTYLVNHGGINPDRLAVAGYGEQRLADEDNPTSKVNRRLEVSLISTGYTVKQKRNRKQLIAQIARHRTTSGAKYGASNRTNAQSGFVSIGRRLGGRYEDFRRAQNDYVVPVAYGVDRQLDDYNSDIFNPPAINGRYGTYNSGNVVCDSYDGVLTDPRPEHMQLDDYDARTPATCPTATEYRGTKTSAYKRSPFAGYSPEGDEELLK